MVISLNSLLNLDQVGAASLIVGFSLSAWSVRLVSNARFKKNIKRLMRATEATNEHRIALASFLDDPCASEGLKVFLMQASDLMEIREFAVVMANLLNQDRSEELKANTIWKEVQHLGSFSPSTYDLFVQAFCSGVISSLLRWPETAETLDQLPMPTNSNLRREVEITASAVFEHESLGSGLMPA